MSRKLKYWVKLDKENTPIAGTNLARPKKPVKDRWQEILKETCCGPEIIAEDVDFTLTGVNVEITCDLGASFVVDLPDDDTTTLVELLTLLNDRFGYVGKFWIDGADIVLKVNSDFYKNFCPEGVLTLAITQSV